MLFCPSVRIIAIKKILKKFWSKTYIFYRFYTTPERTQYKNFKLYFCYISNWIPYIHFYIS